MQDAQNLDVTGFDLVDQQVIRTDDDFPAFGHALTDLVKFWVFAQKKGAALNFGAQAMRRDGVAFSNELND